MAYSPPSKAAAAMTSTPCTPPSHPRYVDSTLTPTASPSSSGSPIRATTTTPSQPGRVLRRKRSSANAALTSRPSMASLQSRDIPHHPSSPTSSRGVVVEELGMHSLSLGETAPTAFSRLEAVGASPPPLGSGGGGGGENLGCLDGEVKQSDCILIHTIQSIPASSTGTLSLGYALLQPNRLVHREGHISAVVDRERWEQLRATAEELRIIVKQARPEESMVDTSTSGSNGPRWSYKLLPSKSTTPCWESAFHIQSSMQAGSTTDESCSFLTLTVQASERATLEEPSAWSCLPSQVQALLNQARLLQLESGPGSSPQSLAMRDRLLHLVDNSSP